MTPAASATQEAKALVPVEPTEAMLLDGWNAGAWLVKNDANDTVLRSIWSAMLAAAEVPCDLKGPRHRDILRPIDWQDVRLHAGEGKLTAEAVLDGVNAELRARRERCDG